jgi:hypothetical protein
MAEVIVQFDGLKSFKRAIDAVVSTLPYPTPLGLRS